MNQATVPAQFNPAIKVKSGCEDLMEDFRRFSDRVAQRAHEFFQMRGSEHGYDVDDWFKAERELLDLVPVEIKETGTGIIVTAQVPGFEAKDLDLRFFGDTLTIKGLVETTSEKKGGGKLVYSERKTNTILRNVVLPIAVKSDAISTNLNKGVFEVKFQKAPTALALQAKAS